MNPQSAEAELKEMDVEALRALLSMLSQLRDRPRILSKPRFVESLIAERNEGHFLHRFEEMGERARETLSRFADVDESLIIRVLKAKQLQIYGDDNRVDLYKQSSPEVDKVSLGVAALFQSRDVVASAGGGYDLVTFAFGKVYELCPKEPFYSQPCGGFGTAFLLTPDTVATAGHCVNESNVKDTCVVFGFRMTNANDASTHVSSSDVYRGTEILGRKFERGGLDWAVFRLDRTVQGRSALPINTRSNLQEGDKVYVVGHPAGLPLKVADGATVRNNSHPDFFVANLDTYGGSSGSPVLNSSSHQVEGILIRGEHDFVRNGNCFVSLVCPQTGCRGEDCLRIQELKGFLV